MPPPLIGGALSDAFVGHLSVCLLHTSGLSREQRGLGRPKLAQRSPTSHVTPVSRSKGQGHQTTLVGCTGRPTWTYSSGDLSIRVHE